MVGPGARKPSVGEGIESRRPLFCSGITTLHSLFIYLFFLSFIFTFASILVCVNNNNNGQVSYSYGTAYNSVATYSCNTGYDLIGTNTRTCSASGDWSCSVPTCYECAHHTVLERVS